MSDTHNSSPRRIYGWLAFAAITVTYVGLASWSWLMWPDVIVDFGHELYIPWQMTEGKVLYEDSRFTMGPLSQYFNFILFRGFGVSLLTLVGANMVILILITLALYRLFVGGATALEATVVCVVFLGLFGFSQYVGVANYNYICPYRHEMTHGVLLCILLVLALRWRTSGTRPVMSIIIVGLLTGLIFLTKSEMLLAAIAANFAAFICWILMRPALTVATIRRGGLGLLAFAAPISCFVFLLGHHVGLSTAVGHILGNLSYTLTGGLTTQYKFYAANLGLIGLGDNIRQMAVAYGYFAASLLLIAAVDRATIRPSRWRRAIAAIAGLLIFGGFHLWCTFAHWQLFFRALPLIAVSAGGYGLWSCRNHRTQSRLLSVSQTTLIWSLLSLALLSKMIFRARIDHYGFVLAMPATLLTVHSALVLFPDHLQRRYGGGGVAKAIVLGVICACLGTHLAKSNEFYVHKVLPIGQGADRFLSFSPETSSRGFLVKEMTELLRQRMGPEESLLILPEGVTVNYLLRVENPTPYYLLTPWEMAAFGGETRILEDIAAAAPDYIGLLLFDTSDHGPAHFGVPGYGSEIVAWVGDEYELFQQYSLRREVGDSFRIRLYKKRQD